MQNFGKLYRSCGNCSSQYQRSSQFWSIVATGGKSELVGINQNYKDRAEFHDITAPSSFTICKKYNGNDTGEEPTTVGSGADGTYCVYQAADIHQ